MKNPDVLKRFSHKKRRFSITLDKSSGDGDESITLSETVRVREKPLKHLMKSDGILDKTEPIIFACRNDTGEVEVSMQYEGFPLEPVLQFLKVVAAHWKS